jgi:hypothetical protein
MSNPDDFEALANGTAVILDPPSTSRKKKRQIGAYVAHKARVQGNVRISHPKSRRRADRKRRKAMGARGVKTNSIRSGRN